MWKVHPINHNTSACSTSTSSDVLFDADRMPTTNTLEAAKPLLPVHTNIYLKATPTATAKERQLEPQQRRIDKHPEETRDHKNETEEDNDTIIMTEPQMQLTVNQVQKQRKDSHAKHPVLSNTTMTTTNANTDKNGNDYNNNNNNNFNSNDVYNEDDDDFMSRIVDGTCRGIFPLSSTYNNISNNNNNTTTTDDDDDPTSLCHLPSCHFNGDLNPFMHCRQPLSFFSFFHEMQNDDEHTSMSETISGGERTIIPIVPMGAFMVRKGCEYCNCSNTKDCNPVTCHRPQYYLQKKRPPFGKKSNVALWDPITDHAININITTTTITTAAAAAAAEGEAATTTATAKVVVDSITPTQSISSPPPPPPPFVPETPNSITSSPTVHSPPPRSPGSCVSDLLLLRPSTPSTPSTATTATTNNNNQNCASPGIATLVVS